MFFPESFYLPQSPEYIDDVYRGLLIAKNTTLLLCGCVKNCEKELSRNLFRVELLKKHFKQLDLFLYENDSVDSTPELVKRADFYKSEKLDAKPHNRDKSIHRRKIMAYARNQYLEFAKSKKYDLFGVIDMDMPGGFSLEGVLHTLSQDFKQKIYGSNSIVYESKQRLYFDTWAYRGYESDKEGDNLMLFHRGIKPVRVDSCFGGLAIYPYSVLEENIEYKDYDCDHVTLHNQLRNKGYKIYINPSMITLYTESYYDKCSYTVSE